MARLLPGSEMLGRGLVFFGYGVSATLQAFLIVLRVEEPQCRDYARRG